jgi:hypothetical protein
VFGVPKDVIVILELPEPLLSPPFELKCGVLFERIDKSQQIAVFLCAFRQQVEVIWHHAVRVNEELFSICMMTQALEQPANQNSVRPEQAPAVKTQRHKIHPATLVVFGRKPDVFPFEIGDHLSCSRSAAASCGAGLEARSAQTIALCAALKGGATLYTRPLRNSSSG